MLSNNPSYLYIYKLVATQRAGTLVAALEPPEETHRVEGVLASGASLIRRLHVRRDHRVTDGTFALALQRALHVLAEGHQSVHKIAVGEHDHALNGEQPALPLPLVHQHSAPPHDEGRLQGICRRKGDRQRHRRRLFINRDARDDLRGPGRNLH